jgi:hypothetical protein
MSGVLFQPPRFTPVNSSGTPYSGAKLYVYRAGTTTQATAYTTSALSVAHANPVVANSAGQFAAVYLDPAADYDYRFVLTNSGGAQLWSEDNVPPFAPLSQAAVGEALYPLIAAETSAGVTPTEYAYPPGDVRRYGATGDGSTDDTTALQAALSVAAESGPAVFLPSGTYKTTSTLTVSDSASMYGEGRTSVIAPVSVNGLTFTGQDTVGGARFFRDFAIVGTTTESNSAIYSDLDSTTARITGVVFSNLYIYGFQKVARCRGFWGCTFEGLYCYNNYQGIHLYKRNVRTQIRNCTFVKGSITGSGERKAVYTEEADALRPEDVQVNDCYIFEYDVGIDIVACLYSGVRGCDIDYAKDVGIRLTQVDGGCVVRDNWIATSDAAAITYGIRTVALGSARTSNVLIENNHVICNEAFTGSTGIAVASNQDCVNVIGNRVTGFDIGISNVAGNFLALRDNTIDADTTAIYIDSLSEDNTVGPNYVESGTALAFSAGTPPRLSYQKQDTFTGTLTGCTTSPTGTVQVQAGGGLVTLTFPTIEGTSNTTAATITGLPAAYRPQTTTRTVLARVKDNGTLAFGCVEVASSGTINLLSSVTSATFTGSGTKGIGLCSVTYPLHG